MFARTIFPLAVIAASGYWYWTGPYQQGRNPTEQEQLRQNAENMERCMRRESSMSGAGGLVGIGGAAGGAKKICADNLNLYFEEGQWRTATR